MQALGFWDVLGLEKSKITDEKRHWALGTTIPEFRNAKDANMNPE